MTTYSNATSNIIDMWFRKFGCYYSILKRTEPVINAPSLIKSKMLKEKIFFIISICIIVLTMLSNLTFIYGLWKTNKVLSFVQRLFIYLSFSDLLVGCVPGFMYAVYILNGSSCFYMSITMALGVCFVILDSSTLFTISMLRLLAILRPFKQVNYKKIVLFLVFEAMISSVIAGASFFMYERSDNISGFTDIVYLISSVLLGFNVATILCILVCLYSIRKNYRRSQTMSNKIQIRKQRKSVVTLMIIASVFMCLTMAEGIALYIIRIELENGFHSFSKNMNTLSMVDLTVISTMLNAALNSFICICRSKKLKRFYANCVKV